MEQTVCFQDETLRFHSQWQLLEEGVIPLWDRNRLEPSPDRKHGTKQQENCNIKSLEYLDCWWLPSAKQGPKCICVFE